jgi:hypothetical protein
VDLEETGCLGCHRTDLQIHMKGSGKLKSRSPALLVAREYAGLTSVSSFMLSPIVIYK